LILAVNHPPVRDTPKSLAKTAAKYLATKSRRELERLAGGRHIPTKKRKGRLLRVPGIGRHGNSP